MPTSPHPSGGPAASDDYAAVARLYDPLTGPLLAPLRRRLTRRAVERGAASAADLCCGTGRQLMLLHAAGLRAAGVDRSPAMLTRARRQCPPGVELVAGDATATPWPDAAFDLCSIGFALHERPRATGLGLLAEARRLLAPGGAVLVLDYRPPRGAAGRLGHLAVGAIERAAGAEHHDHYRHWLTGGGLRPLARETGLACTLADSFLLGAVGLYVLTPA